MELKWTQLPISNLTIQPNSLNNRNSVAMNDNGQATAGGESGVWYSADSGATWILSLALGGGINSVSINNKGHAIASSDYNGVWYSSTPSVASSWTNVLTNPSTSSSIGILSVYLDNNGNAIAGGESGVWYSSNPSVVSSWTNVLPSKNSFNDPLAGQIFSVYLDNNGKAIAGGSTGVWYSTNPSVTVNWTNVVVLGEFNSVSLDNNGNAIAGGNSGVWYSTTPSISVSWTNVIVAGFFNSVSLNNGNAIAGGNSGTGVWYSSTPSVILSWTKVIVAGIFYSVSLNNNGNAMAVGTGGGVNTGIFYSSTPSVTLSWNSITIIGKYRNQFVSVVLNNNGNAIIGGLSGVYYSSNPITSFSYGQCLPGTSGTIIKYVSMNNNSQVIAGGNGGVWYSSDSGTTWKLVLTIFVVTSVYLDNKGNALVAGTNGVWYSPNLTTTSLWTNVLLSYDSMDNIIAGSINSVYLDNSGNAIAGGDNGVWYSPNLTTTSLWTNVLLYEDSMNDPIAGTIISVYLDNNGNAIAGGSNGIWYSPNLTTTSLWTNVLPYQDSMGNLLGGVILYVSLDNKGNAIGNNNNIGNNKLNGGVWYSSNPLLASSWTNVLPYNDSMGNPFAGVIRSLYLDSKGNAIAATGTGVWYSSTPGSSASWNQVLKGIINNKGSIYRSVYLDNNGNAIAGGYYFENGNSNLLYAPKLTTTSTWINLLSKPAGGGIYAVGLDDSGHVIAGGFDVNGGGSWYSPLIPPPISNICFPAGTPVKTDQGIIPIDKIDKTIHTINNQVIRHITITKTLEKYLICFRANCLGKNYPEKRTIMTKDHKIEYKGQLVSASCFLDITSDVKKVAYNGELLYNILLAEHGRINVNNLICETLHPENIIAKLYTSNFSEGDMSKIICTMNDSLLKKDLPIYKSIIETVKYSGS